MKFMKDAMSDGAKRVYKFIKEHGRYPNSLAMTKSDGKKITLNKGQYMGLYQAENIFRIKNGRQPNYTSLVSTSKYPLAIDYQNYKMSCCPTSLSMASQLLFHYKSEKKCIEALETKVKTTGTSPEMLINGAKKLGFKVTRIERNSKAVKKAIESGCAVIMHIETGGKSRPKCLGYLNNYGHYILCYGINGGKYLIADPTKGLKQCKFSSIDKALNGRNLGYYKISPL